MINFSSLKGLPARLARPLVALALLATAGAAQAQTPATFAAAVTYPTLGSISLRVVAGDLNGDGRPDAVTANIISNNVSVFLNSGNGIFGTAALYTVAPNGVQVQGLTLGDVNADGRLDIVTANNGNNTVSVLLGQAGGTFGAYTSYTTGNNTEPRNAALADVNNDGRLDIVTGNSASNSVSVLLGQAGGGFAAPVLYATSGQNFDVAVGDVTGDGILDIVAPSYATNSVNVVPGVAGGTFGTFTSYSTGSNSSSVAVRLGDVNLDGRLDVVVGNQNTSVSVLLGQAGGTLAASANYPTTGIASVYAVSIGDLNGDGRPDLVAGNFQGSLIGVLLGQASGFGPITTFAGNNGPQGVTVSDVNSDGKLDILTANRNNNTLGVLLNTTAFAAPTLTSLNPTSGPVGTSVTLTGTNLGSTTGVSFNGTNAPGFVVNSPTSVTVNVPTGATSGNVTVTTPGGTSNGLAFAVSVVPTVSTDTPGSITATGAVLGGSVTADGNAIVTERGVVYSSTNNNPTIGAAGVTQDINGTGTGNFSKTISGLAANTTYYVRAYATNNAGTSYGSPLSFTTPAAPTSVVSINRAGSNPTNAASVSYTVTFAASVTGLSASNFGLVATGSVAGASITGVTGSGTTYTVAVSTGTGDGTLGLNLTTAAGLTPGLSNALPFVGQVYTIDKTAPTVTITSPVAPDGGYTTTSPLTYVLTFSEDVSSPTVSVTNFGGGSLTRTSANTFAVSVTPGGPGSVRLTVNPNTSTDAAGNASPAASYTIFYNVPTTAPVLTSPANNSTLASGLPTYAGTAPAGSTVTVYVNGTSIGTTTASGTTGTGNFSLAQPTALPAGTYAVYATALATGQTVSANSNTNTFTVAFAPTLTRLSPTSGPAGTSVTLTGTNLTGATGVSFNGTAATVFSTGTGTTLTATVPAGATSGLVTVTTPGGTSNGLAFVVGTPANNALALDGNDDYVNLPTSTAYDLTASFTIETWLKPVGSGNATQNVLCKSSISQNTGYIFPRTDDTWNSLRIWLHRAGGWSQYTVPYAAYVGTWHHVAATYDGTTVRMYIDGAAVTPVATGNVVTGPVATNTNPLTIGSQPGYGEYYRGTLDETRVYNTVLTQAQVQADMFSTAAAVPSNLVAYFNFDQGIAGGNNAGLTALPDLSGTGNTGTLTNFALTGTTSNWVRSFPTITGITPTSGVVGTSVSITGTNLLDATGFAFNGTSTTGFTTPTSDLAATITVPTGATTGPVSVSSATLTRYNGPVFTVSTTAVTWTGAVSTDWFTASNWTSNQVPDATIDATIPTSPSGNRFPIIVANASPANARNLSIAAGASLTMSANTLILAANLANNGTFNGFSGSNGGTLALGGSAPALLNGGGVNRFWNLTVGANGAQLNNPNVTSVRRVLTLNGTFAANGNPFTLISDAAGTAMVVNNGSAVVSGNVTVQRYIDPSLNPNRGYRHVSAAISNATVGSLATSGFTPVVNPAYNTSPTPLLTVPFPTVYGYDQSRLATTNNNVNAFDKGWYSPNATSDPLAVGQGYTVLIGGGQTWNFTGPLNNGNVTQNLARNAGATAPDAGYALVGNPYPSPLDWSQVSPADRPNVGGTVYVYKSTDPANPYTGVYGFYSADAGIGTTSPVLAQGQGFFVRVADGQTAGAVTFRNSQRPTSYTSPTYQRTTETRPLVEMNLHGTGSTLTDAAFVYFEQGATDSFDAQYDAEKLANPSGLNLSTSLSATQRLSIDGRAPLGTAQRVVPLAVGVPAVGSYTLTAAQLLNLGNTPVYLRDLQSGAVVDLRAQSSYSFTVSNASALITGRFELVFSPQAPLATAPAALAAQVGLYPNPATAAAFVELPAALGRTAVSATLVDALGRSVRTQLLPAQGAAAHRLDLAELAAGVYTLHLKTSAGIIVKKLVVE
ncbi:FG-GAP-like repeat-containing protein [Hymenobacter sp. M29]|uniref:FG-GAP-like repeat-containing protein n=1 Tax=Hymenobacter mellowenesis TaxID=3063995 RepID=A0ABT9AJ48_9BACT|nr:FG-GAP-like repeat-containing protein [Hymenobacter sp. M29]MDO7848991.1 FG-GAP-like repeat-containing protein [Hymenobacter sp. M29]